MNFEGSLGQLGGIIRLLLPIGMIVMILVAMIAYGVINLLPELRLSYSLSSQVDDLKQNLQDREAEAEQNTFVTVLQSQIDDTNAMLAETANTTYLTKPQADAILDHLYAYARASGVEIINLQSQDVDQETETDLYSQSFYHLEVGGNVVRLMNFTMRIQELAMPGVTIQNLNVRFDVQTERSLLDVDLHVYISPYADGTALDNLPVIEVPDPVDVELVLDPVSPPVEETVDTAVSAPPQETPTTPETQNTPVESQAAAAEACPSAPPTLFQIGDRVVVDFNGSGSLNILPRVRQSETDVINAIDIARDNDQLLLLDGPVCGEWRESQLWYWFVDMRGTRGWAAEASDNDRWLCPESTPECAE